MRTRSKFLLPFVAGVSALLAAGCSSLQTPATADVAVSNAAVESAASAGGAQFAPLEMNAARSKLALATQALARKEYALAIRLADQSKADADLAQSKANSTKARTAADALQESIRALRDEIKRKQS